jgi:uncharacterized protein YndB with AHSA1/START domain
MKKLLAVLTCLVPWGALAQTTDYVIHWPKEYEPAVSRFFVHNEIEINAPAEIIWQLLLEAEAWPTWYEGARAVDVLNVPTLEDRAVFTWKTMGLQFESTIKEFEAPYRLSWESRKKSIQGYHAWLLIPTPRGCRVITDESQNGWLTALEKTFQRKKLQRLHDVWLAALKQRAEAAVANP